MLCKTTFYPTCWKEVEIEEPFKVKDKSSSFSVLNNVFNSKILTCMVTTYKISKEFGETGEGCILKVCLWCCHRTFSSAADQKIYAAQTLKGFQSNSTFLPPSFHIVASTHFPGKLEIFWVGITDISSLPQGFGPWEVEKK